MPFEHLKILEIPGFTKCGRYEYLLSRRAGNLVELGHEVNVLSGKTRCIEALYKDAGVMLLSSKLGISPVAEPALAMLIKKNQLDIVQIYDPSIIKKVSRAVSIARRGVVVLSLRESKVKKYSGSLLKKAGMVVVNSENMKRTIIDSELLNPVSVACINDGLDPGLVKLNSQNDDNKNSVLLTDLPSDRNALESIVGVIHNVADQHPEVVYEAVLDDREGYPAASVKSHLQELLKERELSDKLSIQTIEFSKSSEVPQCIFAVSFIADDLSDSTASYLYANGMAVAAPRKSCFGDIIDKTKSIAGFSSDDPESLEKVITKLIRDTAYRTRLITKAKDSFENEWSAQRRAVEYERLYLSLITPFYS